MAISDALNSTSMFGNIFIIEKANIAELKSTQLDFGLLFLQSVIAGWVLKDLSGPGLLGTAAFGAGVVAPLCTRGIKMLTQKNGSLQNPTFHKIAHSAEHIYRIAAKVVLTVIMANIFAKQIMQKTLANSLRTLFVTAQTSVCAYCLLDELCDTINWLKSKTPDYFQFRVSQGNLLITTKLKKVQNLLFSNK